MRKAIILTIAFICCLMLGGCLIETIDLTDNERNIIAQYAADKLLKYDRNYTDMLVSEVKLTEAPKVTHAPNETPTPTLRPGEKTPTPVPTKDPAEITPTPTPTDIPDNTEFTNETLTNVITTDNGLYARYIGTSEPVESFTMGDAASALNPIPGIKYIITKFTVSNDTEEPLELNTFEKKLGCTLMYNDGKTQTAETTLFTNDIRFIGTGDAEFIAPGEAYDAILVFRIPADEEIEKAAISMINKDGDAVIIKIK